LQELEAAGIEGPSIPADSSITEPRGVDRLRERMSLTRWGREAAFLGGENTPEGDL